MDAWICTPATDRVLEIGLSRRKSVRTRKMVELCFRKAKSSNILVEARTDTDVEIVRSTWVCEGQRTNRTIQWLVPSEVSLRTAGAEQFC